MEITTPHVPKDLLGSVAQNKLKRIKTALLSKPFTLAGIPFPANSELRFKERPGEDVLMEAELAGPATVLGIPCIKGAVVGFFELTVWDLRAAFSEARDVQGFPVEAMSTLAFDPAGKVVDFILARDFPLRGRTFPKGSRIRLGGESMTVSLAADWENFPRESDVVFTADGKWAHAVPSKDLKIGADIFKKTKTVILKPDGGVDRVGCAVKGALEFSSLTPQEQQEYHARTRRT